MQSDDEVGCLHGLPWWWRSGAAEHLEVTHERAEGAVVVEQLERGLHGYGAGLGGCTVRGYVG